MIRVKPTTTHLLLAYVSDFFFFPPLFLLPIAQIPGQVAPKDFFWFTDDQSPGDSLGYQGLGVACGKQTGETVLVLLFKSSCFAYVLEKNFAGSLE